MDDIARLYLATTTTSTLISMMTSERNKILNVTIIPRKGYNDAITIDMPTLTNTDKLSNTTHFTNSTLNRLITRRSLNIDNDFNTSTFSNKNLTTDVFKLNLEHSIIPLKYNKTVNTYVFLFNNNYSNLPVVTTESINLLEDSKKNGEFLKMLYI